MMVVVTNVGLLSPAGVGLEALRAAAGAPSEPRSTKDWTLDDGSTFSTRFVPAKLRKLFDPPPPRLSRLDRYPRLFLAAGLLALQGVEWTDEERLRCGVAAGSSFGCWGVNEEYLRGLDMRGVRLSSPLHFGYTVPGSAAGELSIAGRLRGPNATWVSGRCSGLLAVSVAARWIEDGRCDRALAGAVDAQGPWLARELRDAGWRSGVPGEGAVVLLLERSDDAQRAGRTPLCRVQPGRGWFDASQTGDAWSVPSEPLPGTDAVGDGFAAGALWSGLLEQPSEFSVQGRCGHGASLVLRGVS